MKVNFLPESIFILAKEAGKIICFFNGCPSKNNAIISKKRGEKSSGLSDKSSPHVNVFFSTDILIKVDKVSAQRIKR